MVNKTRFFFVTDFFTTKTGFMSFPQQTQFDNAMEFCNICYTYRLNNQIPIVSCDNEKCSMIFHTGCLKEWFSSLRDTKTFLNMTSGRCPSCKEVDNSRSIIETISRHAKFQRIIIWIYRNYRPPSITCWSNKFNKQMPILLILFNYFLYPNIQYFHIISMMILSSIFGNHLFLSKKKKKQK